MKYILIIVLCLIHLTGCSHTINNNQILSSNNSTEVLNYNTFYASIYNLETKESDIFPYDMLEYENFYFVVCNTNPIYLLKINQEGILINAHSISINNVLEKPFFFHTSDNFYLVVCSQKSINLKTSSCLNFLPIDFNTCKIDIDQAINFTYPNIIVSIKKSISNENNLIIGGSYYIDKFYDEFSKKIFIARFNEQNGKVSQKFFSMLYDTNIGDVFQSMLYDDYENTFFIAKDYHTYKTTKTKLCKIDGYGNIIYVKLLPDEFGLKSKNQLFYLNKSYVIINDKYVTKFDQEGFLFESKKLSINLDSIDFYPSSSGLIGFCGYNKNKKEEVLIISLSSNLDFIEIKSFSIFLDIPSMVIHSTNNIVIGGWKKENKETGTFGFIIKELIDQNSWKLPLKNFIKKTPKRINLIMNTEDIYTSDYLDNFYKLQPQDYLINSEIKTIIDQSDFQKMIKISLSDSFD